MNKMRDPDIIGESGKAWNCLAEMPLTGQHAHVSMWIVNAPGYHPHWDNYWIGAFHLRAGEGLPEPIINIPGSTHQIYLWALAPEWEINLSEMPVRLTPINFTGEFTAKDDEHADEIIEEAVRDIVEGRISPDSDYIRAWANRFTDSHIKK